MTVSRPGPSRARIALAAAAGLAAMSGPVSLGALDAKRIGQEAPAPTLQGCEPVGDHIIILPTPERAPWVEVRPPITVGWPAPDAPELLLKPVRLDLLLQPTPQQALDQAFLPVESDGLIAQVTSISASVSVNQHRFGVAGVRVQRSFSLGGSLYDLSGTRSFRIVGSPRLVEITDESGQSLIDRGTWSFYPDSSSPQAFSRPTNSPGSMGEQSFSVSCNDLDSVPRVIRTLRLELDVASAGTGDEHLIRAEVKDEFQQVAPGLEARVSAIQQQGGTTTVGVEYRITPDADTGARAWFVSAEVLDDEQRPLQLVEHAQEAETRTSVVGAVSFWGIDTRDVPIWYVRLRFVPGGAMRTIEIVEHDLPLLGQ